MSRTFYYTGIGSRETPDHIKQIMIELARTLARRGMVLRSGGAPGADDAFEQGAPNDRQRIYIPWNGFQDRVHGSDGALDPSKAFSRELYAKATDIASRHHPGWHNMKPAVKKLMTRNVFQLLGDDLETPSRFVWCWAPQPKFDKQDKLIDVSGGTGLAVRLAATYGVPAYNMFVDRHMAVLKSFLEKWELSEQTPIAQAPSNSTRRI